MVGMYLCDLRKVSGITHHSVTDAHPFLLFHVVLHLAQLSAPLSFTGKSVQYCSVLHFDSK